MYASFRNQNLGVLARHLDALVQMWKQSLPVSISISALKVAVPTNEIPIFKITVEEDFESISSLLGPAKCVFFSGTPCISIGAQI